MKITVVYNQVAELSFGQPEDILADGDTVKTAKEIATALLSLGYKIDLFAIDEQSAGRLTTYETDLFFNTAFGIGSVPKSEADVAELLGKTGKPYTGSNAKAIVLTTDKVATKKILSAAGLPTPKWQVFDNSEEFDPGINFPVIIKPGNEDCSLGISPSSVVESASALQKQVKKLQKVYREPVLVEEYIAGRELNVTVLGNGKRAEVLPISEIVFGPSFKNKYKIVDFTAKWKEETEEYRETVGACPAKLPKSTEESVKRISLAAYQLTGCNDYARVDIRLSSDGMPYVLEVNANPGVGPEDGVVRSAKAAGYNYPQFLEAIIKITAERFQKTKYA